MRGEAEAYSGWMAHFAPADMRALSAKIAIRARLAAPRADDARGSAEARVGLAEMYRRSKERSLAAIASAMNLRRERAQHRWRIATDGIVEA